MVIPTTQELLSFLQHLFSYDPKNPMLFNSGAFLLLFTVFLSIYSIVYKQKAVRTIYVIAFSLFFYYKASGWYLGILLLSIILDYWVALAIYQSNKPWKKKLLLAISLTANIALLCYFKYTNFFIGNINAIGHTHIALMDIFLPIGISFYTFQTISYVVDAYKGVIVPTRNLLDYTFYMSFFPHLVAGPIVRARHFLPQIDKPAKLTRDDLGDGFYLVVKGLIKKAIIADYVSQYADLVFAAPGNYSGFENLMAMYAYTLQIYCDFSGYSDMAIGIAKWMGFDLGPNFNTPYISRNVTEFWRRWHISLSTWLRDYVYISFGGNRKGEFNQYIFLLLTMLIGGFWHGPSWKFVIWGAAHGVALVLHKIFHKYIGSKLPKNWFLDFIGWALTFHFVALLWIFFRADTFDSAILMIRQICTHMDLAYIEPFINARVLFLIILGLGYMVQFFPEKFKLFYGTAVGRFPVLAKAALLVVVIQIILQLQVEGVKPFIYFQF